MTAGIKMTPTWFVNSLGSLQVINMLMYLEPNLAQEQEIYGLMMSIVVEAKVILNGADIEVGVFTIAHIGTTQVYIVIEVNCVFWHNI